MKKYLKALAVAVSCVGIFGAASGAAYAFLYKPTNRLDNVVTPGSIVIRLTEPDWEPEEGKDLVPRETVAKDPTVTNTGKNDAWVFLRVDIPIRHLALVDEETKRKQEAADTELFSFTTQEGWTLISRTADDSSAHYVYGYDTVVGPGETTTALFTDITLVNYLEGELDSEETFTIPIQAVAIQANVETAGDSLEAVYMEYLRQETADVSGTADTDSKADAEGGRADETETDIEE